MTGGQFADPNREAVGLEPAWAEGFGGSDTSGGSGPAADAEQDTEKDEKAAGKTGKPKGKAAGRD